MVKGKVLHLYMSQSPWSMCTCQELAKDHEKLCRLFNQADSPTNLYRTPTELEEPTIIELNITNWNGHFFSDSSKNVPSGKLTWQWNINFFTRKCIFNPGPVISASFVSLSVDLIAGQCISWVKLCPRTSPKKMMFKQFPQRRCIFMKVFKLQIWRRTTSIHPLFF